MRWKKIFKPKETLRLGIERTVTRFLFLPRTINGETRWLELVKIKQRFQKIPVSGYELHAPAANIKWVDVEWIKKGDL
jgi:hypothetical protein